MSCDGQGRCQAGLLPLATSQGPWYCHLTGVLAQARSCRQSVTCGLSVQGPICHKLCVVVSNHQLGWGNSQWTLKSFLEVLSLCVTSAGTVTQQL